MEVGGRDRERRTARAVAGQAQENPTELCAGRSEPAVSACQSRRRAYRVHSLALGQAVDPTKLLICLCSSLGDAYRLIEIFVEKDDELDTNAMAVDADLRVLLLGFGEPRNRYLPELAVQVLSRR